MTKVVMTGSSGARSAKGRKPNEIINTKRDYAFVRKEFFNGFGETLTFCTGAVQSSGPADSGPF